MTEAWQRRLLALTALLVAAGALGWITMGELSESEVYYLSPTELLDKQNNVGKTVRLGGQVEPGTVDYQPSEKLLSFVVTDSKTSMSVISTGAPPQMFREGIGVVVEGQLAANGTFESDRLMVKHSNEYQAPEDGGEHDPKVLYGSLEEESK